MKKLIIVDCENISIKSIKNKLEKEALSTEIVLFLGYNQGISDVPIGRPIEFLRATGTGKDYLDFQLVVEVTTRAIKKKYDNIRLLLVGNFEHNLDPVKPETLKIIDENPGIELLGPKYGDDLLACYAASDCFVFPSYREGFPNTVMEAGAMGLPSIVTDINGSREIIIQNENGIIIPSKDADALYQAMEEMINNPDKTNTYANNARKMIASRFERSFVCQCLYNFYEEII